MNFLFGRLPLLAVSAWLISLPAHAHELTNGRITLDQADASTGFNDTTQDRVDSIFWIDSDGNSTGNLVSEGGPNDCGDPQEYFGQSYGETDGTSLLLVVGGTAAKWREKANGLSGKSSTTGTDACFTLSGKTQTSYQLQNASSLVNALKITRMFSFFPNAPQSNLRAYTPRLSHAKYTTVLLPDSKGVVQTRNVSDCPMACEISDWNGTWFADDDGSGNGMAVVRDQSSTWPAVIAMDYDGYSASNVTSVLLMMPTGGWSGKVTETEWLCFYDAKSWTARQRKAGKLPAGCKVKTP